MMSRITRVIEMWKTRAGSVERITWNPCNCHPNDVMREFGYRLKRAVSYSSRNKSSFTKWLKSRGHIRISRKIITIKHPLQKIEKCSCETDYCSIHGSTP